MDIDIEAERKLFEAWAITDNGNCCQWDLRKIDGEYCGQATHRDWLIWQARAALAAHLLLPAITQREPICWRYVKPFAGDPYTDVVQDDIIYREKFYPDGSAFEPCGSVNGYTEMALYDHPMPPAAPVLSDEELDELVEWVVSLAADYDVNGIRGLLAKMAKQ